MVQILENPNPSIAGRLGKGIAQGLAEQLPKEIERGRLSYGLKQLGKQDLSGKNRLELLGEIASIPGLSPEMQKVALKQVTSQNFANRNRESAKNKISPEKQTESLIPVGEKSKSGFATPNQLRQYRESILQEPPTAEINSLASEYFENGYADDIDSARAMAREALQQDIKAQDKRISDFRKATDERMKLDLQTMGLGDYSGILGAIQQKLLDEGEMRIGQQGRSPQQVAKEMEDIARELALAATQTKIAGATSPVDKSYDSKISDLRANRKLYEKYGFEQFYDDIAAQSLGSTPLGAARFLDPIKNSELDKSIKEASTWKAKFKDIANAVKGPFGETAYRISEKDLDKIIDRVKEEDNILSVMDKLRERNIDVNQFRDRILQRYYGGTKGLSEKQLIQAGKSVGNSMFGDILLKTFGE